MRFMTQRLLLCGLLIALPVGTLCAQDELPSGEEVIAKYVKATGGKEKYAALKTQLIDATLNIPESGISGSMEMSFKKGKGMLAEIDIEGIGMTRRGLSGEVGWESSEIQGARILDKEETEALKMGSDPSAILDQQKNYKSVKCTGIEEVDGDKCYKIVSVSKSDREQSDFYSVESGLLVKSVTTAPSPFGEITVESMISDYREVEGMKFAFKTSQKLSVGVTQDIEIKEIKLNVELSDDKFELPEEVEALQDK